MLTALIVVVLMCLETLHHHRPLTPGGEACLD